MKETKPVIGKLVPGSGLITEYTLPGESATRISAGPDGNIWFTLYGKIGKITPSGTVTEYSLPSGYSPSWITTGPDDNMWFTVNEENAKIGKITP